MKKVVAILLIVSCCITVSSAFAHNLYVFTDDELKALNIEIQQELINRGLSEYSTVTTGYYIAGVDFPAGSYLLTFYKTQSYPKYCIYSAMGQQEPVIVAYIESNSLRLSLPEGYVLYLEGIDLATIEKLEPLFSE